MTYIPFTYLIGWSKYNKWYYGVRYAKNCHPHDLWTSYFTSSTKVKETRDLLGEPDVIRIRRIFTSAAEAKLWEEKVLRRLKVLHKNNWLNQNVAGAIVNSRSTIDRLTEIKKRQVISAEQRAKISKSLKRHNSTLSADDRKSRSLRANTSMWEKYRHDEEFRNTIRQHRRLQTNPMTGRKQARICCCLCRKDLPINQLKTHACNPG